MLIGTATLTGLSNPPASSADPKFPDIYKLELVPAAAFANPDQRHQYGGQPPADLDWDLQFRTKEGVVCANFFWKVSGTLICQGPVPGAPAGTVGVDLSQITFDNDLGPASFRTHLTPRFPAAEDVPLLEPGQQLRVLGPDFTCGVPGDGVLACRFKPTTYSSKADHGFVIAPAGSWVF